MANYIFYDGELLERAGGPSTYLYNLKKGIEKSNSNEIKFISRKSTNEYKKSNLYKKLKQKGIEKFPKLYEKIAIKHQMNESEIFESLAKIDDIELIHFHSTSNYVKAKKYLNEGTVTLLMSHSPEITSKQVSKSLSDKYKGKYEFQKMEKFYFETFDKQAFKTADILIFPSKEAMEPYYETCQEFDKIIQGKEIKYIMTGTAPLQYELKSEEFRNKYNIPKDAFVISFVGRHNEVKGYDKFLSIAQKVLEKNNNIYVVTAGVGPIGSPKLKRWIDVGWTKDPGSVINASDLFILPNKRTYFDLILLEVLSLGKACLASNTGGNKTIAGLTNGVITYNEIDEAVEIIESLKNNKKKLKELDMENLEIYKKYFTVGKFVERYISLIDEIRKEKGIGGKK